MCEQNNEKKVLVLGVGNFLCGDDGIGPILAERMIPLFEDDPDLELLNGGAIGLGLIYLFETYTNIIFIDAVDLKARPGTVFKFTLDDLGKALDEDKLSSHQSDPYELMLYAKTIGYSPENVVILGIQIDQLEPKIGLSEALLSQLDKIEELICAEIRGFLQACTKSR